MMSYFKPAHHLFFSKLNLIVLIIVFPRQNGLKEAVHIENLLTGYCWIVEEVIYDSIFDSSWVIVVDEIDEFN